MVHVIRFLLRASESRILRKLRMTLSQQQPRSVPPGSVILREVRLKDRLLVASVGVADPSQAQDDSPTGQSEQPLMLVGPPTAARASSPSVWATTCSYAGFLSDGMSPLET